jgi:serine/threonine-protein kinase
VYDLKADSARVLVPRAIAAWYSTTGHILYKTRDGSLLAAPFDAKTLTLTGAGVPILDGLASTGFALSANGTVIYAMDPAQNRAAELQWVARDGSTSPFDTTWKAAFDYPALSPDGASLAVSVTGRTTDLWMRRADGVRERLPLPGAVNWRPSWRADGQGLAYITVKDPAKNPDDATVHWVGAAPGADDSLLLAHSTSVWEVELSHDNQWMVFRTDEPQGSVIRARRLTGDTTVIPVAVDSSRNLQPMLSPDGAWIAYISTETGTAEVYVAEFPTLKGRRQISRGGGLEPRWSRSGNELFYVGGDQFMTVPIKRSPGLEAGEPVTLFSLRGFRRARNKAQYDVAPGDQKFLMIKDPPPPPMPTVIMVEHWFPELLAKLKH